MKRKFMMLSLLILGPKQPSRDIDIFSAPLMDGLKLLWEDGVKDYDLYAAKMFTLKAVLLWTINNFPAYRNLSGWTVKGYKACQIFSSKTFVIRLQASKKEAYMGHRRVLPEGHKFRRQKKAFNGKIEDRQPPNPLTGHEVVSIVEGIPNIWGKKQKKRKRVNQDSNQIAFNKKSILFELQYWEFLYVRHCLDVMHIEKNICESVISTLLDIPGKGWVKCPRGPKGIEYLGRITNSI